MATKKAVAKKTAVPAKKTVAKSALGKAEAAVKAPMSKMTKTQVIRYMAEQMEVPPKQVAGFFNLLIENATAQTRKLCEFTIPGLGKLIKAQRASRMGGPGNGRCDQDQGLDDSQFQLAKPAMDAVVPPKHSPGQA